MAQWLSVLLVYVDAFWRPRHETETDGLIGTGGTPDLPNPDKAIYGAKISGRNRPQPVIPASHLQMWKQHRQPAASATPKVWPASYIRWGIFSVVAFGIN
ncbi:hypothetical protein F5B18DRAFT_427014 [Nemania serpens]|nr:hypothetical protein F5B18DRAFT_427014 [Nemania serpens]